MEALDTVEALQPYLNPEYWHGHMLGDGDAVGQAALSLEGAMTAARLFREQVNQRPKPPTFPIETFKDGDNFNPDEYNPGTTILLRRESLSRRIGRPLVQMHTASQQLVERSFETNAFVAPGEDGLVLKAWGIQYYDSTEWGIIMDTGPKGHRLHVIPTDAVIRSGGRTRLIVPIMPPVAFRGVVGRAVHGVRPAGREQVERVNILHITGYGRRVKRRRILDLLSKPALAHR